MLSKQETAEIDEMLKTKISLAKKLKHNKSELQNIEELKCRGKYPELEKELNEKLCIGDELVYNQKESLKELSCPRIAAIFDVSQQTIASREGKLKRRI